MSKALFVDTVYERAHKLAQALQSNYDSNGYSSDTVFDIKEGRKYIKISMINNQESVHAFIDAKTGDCLLYTSPSPRDRTRSRMPSSA